MGVSFHRGTSEWATAIALSLGTAAVGCNGATASDSPQHALPSLDAGLEGDAAGVDAGGPDGSTGTEDGSPSGGDAASGDDGSDGPIVVADVCHAPQGSSDSAQNLALGDTTFALAVYPPAAATAGTGANVVFSPYSVSTTLTMVDVGAEGETASQIESVLDLPGSAATEAPAYAALACRLESDGSSSGNELLIANSLWGQQGFPFESTFESVLAGGYDAPLQQVDFETNPSDAETSINAWVSGKTMGLIPTLLQPGDLTTDTRFVLVNALYFKGVWASGFDPSQTAAQPFTLSSGTQVSTATMHAMLYARWAQTQDLTVVELPYRGDALAMDILMPTLASGGVATLAAALTPSALSADLATLEGGNPLDLYVPKFSFTSRFALIPVLTGLGMTDAFNASLADFSGIDGQKDLSLSLVVQQAFVEVDEQGTVAAAATAAGGSLASVVVEPITLHVDHPFLFLIRDVHSGSILFMGQVFDPRP